MCASIVAHSDAAPIPEAAEHVFDSVPLSIKAFVMRPVRGCAGRRGFPAISCGGRRLEAVMN